MAKRQSLEKYKEKNKTLHRRWDMIRVRVFTVLIAVFFVLGLLLFLRPKQSATEKRDLATFPALSLSGIWDGSWFSDVETWYADSYPMREKLIAAGTNIENLYGIRNSAIYVAAPSTQTQTTDQSQQTDSNSTASGSATASSTEETDAGGAITIQPESAGTIYVADGRGFELYYSNHDSLDAYASMINTVADNLGDNADVYVMGIPNSFGIMLDESIQSSMGCPLQSDETEYIYDQINDNVKKIEIYDTLRAHNDEYLYFRTDHHWTQRGAYYAYTKFCEAKGITAHSLDDYESKSYEGFLGTFYAASNQSPELGNNPDTVETFIPIATNDEVITDSDGKTYDRNIVGDADSLGTESKYLCFIGGDQPLVEIDNPDINDGSACILIKESYGNAFAPFLADHYDKVYIVDYRYSSADLTALAKQQTSCDVIFANVMILLDDTARAQKMQALFPAE